MSWHYRVAKKSFTPNNGFAIGIYEVYTDAKGRIFAYDDCGPWFDCFLNEAEKESLQELKEELKAMIEAVDEALKLPAIPSETDLVDPKAEVPF